MFKNNNYYVTNLATLSKKVFTQTQISDIYSNVDFDTHIYSNCLCMYVCIYIYIYIYIYKRIYIKLYI